MILPQKTMEQLQEMKKDKNVTKWELAAKAIDDMHRKWKKAKQKKG